MLTLPGGGLISPGEKVAGLGDDGGGSEEGKKTREDDGEV